MKTWFFRMTICLGLFSFLVDSSLLHAAFQEEERVHILTDGLFLKGRGLEIAPFFRPTLLKKGYNISYTDYATAEELIKKHQHLPIAQQIAADTVELDFIWVPGTDLNKCAPMLFDYAIASHVIEHVPNVIGWLSQILSVLKVGGVLSLAVPNKHFTFDAYRPETHVNEMIDAWLRNQSIPSPAQIYDMLSNSADVPPDHSMPFNEGIPFESLPRNYTDQQALEFAIYSYTTGTYLDIHCSVFTPESLRALLLKINELGLLNVSISEPISRGSEFFIKLKKLGEPRIKHPKA